MTKNSKTKYLLLVGDGMADYPISELGGRTPLEAANTPNMDLIASCRIGCVKTIPDDMEPGSDVANLALMGYDPRKYHTGRSPLEAASMGVDLAENDVAFRMNLVTLDRKSHNEIIMVSHSSGDITTEESCEIVNDLKKFLQIQGTTIYPGVAYRHLLVWKNGPEDALTIPPHDVLDQNMAEYLNSSGNPVVELIRDSWESLEYHPVNNKRKKALLKEANSIWLWGQGKAPAVPLFKDIYGLEGGVISAVDLIKGIGKYAGFKPIYVEGATGYLDTNYSGKAKGAVNGLKDMDFVFVHVEAPDEAGHNGNYREKIQAIESFDRDVVGVALHGLKNFDDYRIMVVSDHYTPVIKKTHTREPAPFAWATAKELESAKRDKGFTEKYAVESSLLIDPGHRLMVDFLGVK
ncbi:MAG: cofactor-independent phosphoglycerate mutase [Deltaproteobacteria bacterium]|nr:cofactor-independent phosphoglycerate mutase [Deltaproteobacteria bacterium]